MKSIFISCRFFFCVKPVKIYIFLNSAKKIQGIFLKRKNLNWWNKKVFFPWMKLSGGKNFSEDFFSFICVKQSKKQLFLPKCIYFFLQKTIFFFLDSGPIFFFMWNKVNKSFGLFGFVHHYYKFLINIKHLRFHPGEF